MCAFGPRAELLLGSTRLRSRVCVVGACQLNGECADASLPSSLARFCLGRFFGPPNVGSFSQMLSLSLSPPSPLSLFLSAPCAKLFNGKVVETEEESAVCCRSALKVLPMRRMECTVLPVGRRVVLSVAEGGATKKAVVERLFCALRLPVGHVELLVRKDGVFSAFPDGYCGEGVFALTRPRGGGKGGFKKQLEKKGREFERAKAKEVNAKKSVPPVRARRHVGGPKASSKPRLPTKPVPVSTVVSEDRGAARLLAAQGVEAALRRFQTEKR